jgi:predicted glycosyltransferase involved in capsule biosynthesis
MMTKKVSEVLNMNEADVRAKYGVDKNAVLKVMLTDAEVSKEEIVEVLVARKQEEMDEKLRKYEEELMADDREASQLVDMLVRKSGSSQPLTEEGKKRKKLAFYRFESVKHLKALGMDDADAREWFNSRINDEGDYLAEGLQLMKEVKGFKAVPKK